MSVYVSACDSQSWKKYACSNDQMCFGVLSTAAIAKPERNDMPLSSYSVGMITFPCVCQYVCVHACVFVYVCL